MTNTLESLVDQIVENSNYLTPALVGRLFSVLPEASDTKTKKRTLKGQLERMFMMLDKLESLSTGTENVMEMKQVIIAAKDLYTLVAKYEQTVNAQERMQALENTIIDTLDELDGSIKEKFLSLWRSKLEQLNKAGG